MSRTRRNIKVLIVDDSAIVRKILSEAIEAEPGLQVIGTAPDPYVARDKILSLKPDVVTLDIEMPRMDGLTFLRRLMQHYPLPVIIVSSLGQASCAIALEALRIGAVEVLAKPAGSYSVGELRACLAEKVKAAAAARIAVASESQTAAPGPVPNAFASHGCFAAVIAIGASTGGTEAIRTVLAELPSDAPPIVIAQHIPPVFSRTFAAHLEKLCRLRVKEAEDGDALLPGRVLIAPGDFHMLVRKQGCKYSVELKQGPKICYHRPSVDVLFTSVAEAAAADAIGAILTGMGADGAQGLLRMKGAGARTFAQDEATSVVFGMPREAIKLGAADQILGLHDIAPAMISASRAAAPVACS